MSGKAPEFSRRPPLVFAFPGHEPLALKLSERLAGDCGSLVLRRFPDGEAYVRLDTPVAGRPVVMVCGLDDPDARLLPLIFAAETARELGAQRLGIVAPYLGYMRQDTRFQPGEAITSRIFAGCVSGCADWLLTVDPHLHRFGSLAQIYPIRTAVAHAAPAIAAWIAAHVSAPLIVGPDSESEQWVAAVAAQAGAPYTVLHKSRRGDRSVEISLPAMDEWRARTPVLVDDIVSTARTMIETARRLQQAGMAAAVCVGVHAIFAQNAYAELLASGVARVVTCNSIPHPSNGIDLAPAIVQEAVRLLAGCN